MLRAELDAPVNAAPPVVALPPLPVPQPGTHDTVLQLQAQVRQQRRVRALRLTRGGQLDEKQTSLEETASLVEKMFVEFSTLQGACSCPACPAPAHPALPPPLRS
jgi:hypothetical protein